MKDGIETNGEIDFEDYAHTAPGTIAGRYMRLFWHPVFIAENLPVGRPLPITVMSENFTIYRGESGKVFVCQPRCPHRGALFTIGRVEGDNLRCSYHGWMFDGEGKCVQAPAERAGFCQNVNIRQYPVQEYIGLIFLWLGEGAPAPLPRYPRFEGSGVLDVMTYLRPCNYFNNIDNNVDPAHTPFTHAVSNYTNFGLQGVPEVLGRENEWGIVQYGKRPSGGVRVSYHGQPTMLNIKFQPADDESGWQELLAWRVPIDDTRHIGYMVNYVNVEGDKAERYRKKMAERRERRAAAPPAHELAERIVRGEMRIEETNDHPDYFEIQDHVAQMSQGTIADRKRELLGRSDVLVVLLRRIWSREMKAMVEGRPLKQWRYPDGMEPTTGSEPVEIDLRSPQPA